MHAHVCLTQLHNIPEYEVAIIILYLHLVALGIVFSLAQDKVI